MQELVREVRKEMNPTTSGAGAGGGQEDQEELCFEVIATVLEIFGRMDSLVGSVYFHFHSHCVLIVGLLSFNEYGSCKETFVTPYPFVASIWRLLPT